MNKELNFLLWAFFTLNLLLTACYNSDKSKANTAVSMKVDFKDTTFIKSIKWDSLNEFVDYHILLNGHKATDSNFHFTAKTIAVYHYSNNEFNLSSDNAKFEFKPNELKGFILSDRFSDKRDFDCLLRINSQIGFRYKPVFLRTIIISAKDTSHKGIISLISSLKKESFTQDIKSEVANIPVLNTLTRTANDRVFIKLKLKPDYWDLRKIKEVCSQLKRRPDVEDAFFTDFFTGLNEEEVIYHLTSTDNGSH